MKHYCFILFVFLLIFFLGCTIGSEDKNFNFENELVRIGIYNIGPHPACITAGKKMFEWMDYEVVFIDSNHINQNRLNGFRLIYFPGGDCYPFQRDINKEGRENLRNWVRQGGACIGTCAGALYLSRSTIWYGYAYDPNPYLGLYDGIAIGPINDTICPSSEYGMCELELNKEYILEGELNTSWMMYYNGPYFRTNPTGNSQVVATYIATGDPAIIKCTYGKGRVVLTGPHPEWEEDDDRDGIGFFDNFDDRGSDWDLMKQLTEWCIKKNL